MDLYRLRAEMGVNGGERKFILNCIDNETPEHLAMKLAAYLCFWDEDLLLDASAKTPALSGQEFRPDLLGLDAGGEVALWVECGNTAMHKMSKVVRKWPDARVAMFKDTEAKGRFLREELTRNLPGPDRVEIYCWPARGFREWKELLSEKTEVFGEAKAGAFNLVVNEKIYATDLLRV
ncbi:MAG: YaeQ family protein [Elusimicrobia bacterium]|nr:YaeQ family protein [Elusimicrobiota bacterium]